MTQLGTVYPAAPNSGVTNGREVGAFAIAQLIKFVLSYGLSFSGLLTPLYTWAYAGGGKVAIETLAVSLSVFWAAVVLSLFLVLRGALGGVPAMIAGPGRERAVTSRGGEIGAYVIAYAILIAALTTLIAEVLLPLYTSLARAGQTGTAAGIGIVIAPVGAVVVYALFIGLRSAFCRR